MLSRIFLHSVGISGLAIATTSFTLGVPPSDTVKGIARSAAAAGTVRDRREKEHQTRDADKQRNDDCNLDDRDVPGDRDV